jgi:polyisoprenyl-phosphate glycosyltransferase
LLNKKLLSIVIPMFNEADGMNILFERIELIRKMLPLVSELIIVNDGSTDSTETDLLSAQKRIFNLRIIELSRNFGKEAALACGLEHAKGEAVINLDADLQDSPEIIIEMVSKWQEGFDIVSVVRESRKEDSCIYRFFVKCFYGIFNKISEIKITPNIRDFRLMSRSALNAYLELKERNRFNKGLFAWIGFKEYKIIQPFYKRAAGASKWHFIKLFNFALDGITSLSSAPLRIWSYVGFFTASLAFIYGIFIVIKTLIFGIDSPGYASIISIILFFSGLNMLSIGVLGEYMARIFNETKQRPLYIVRQIHEPVNIIKPKV